MDVGTIVTALFVIGAFALFLVLMRRLPPAEDDVAAVVAAIMRTPIELGRPPADLEEPVRWRIDLLKPHVADRSPFGRSAAPPAKSDRRVPKLATPSHRSTSTP